MILVIDNYDSFTYNLVQYLGELKVELAVHRNDRISIEQIRRCVLRTELPHRKRALFVLLLSAHGLLPAPSRKSPRPVAARSSRPVPMGQ